MVGENFNQAWIGRRTLLQRRETGMPCQNREQQGARESFKDVVAQRYWVM